MTTMYLKKQGSVLRNSGEQFLIDFEGKTLDKIPSLYIDKILIFGNIHVTLPAISLIMDKNIDLSFFSYKGKLKGAIYPNNSKNIYIRLAQFEKFQDHKFKIGIIKDIIRAKLNNQLKVIEKYKSNYSLDCQKEILVLENLILNLENKSEIDEIMGCEGAGSAAYFKFFSKVVKGDFTFEGRKMHPSPDPINAMLSLGYVMLTNEIASLIQARSLDPYLGFLHSLKYGRESLALDIVEEFRQPFIDMFILKLINKKVFTNKDFEVHNNSCNLKEDSLKKFFSLYEEYMNENTKDYYKEEKSRRYFLIKQVDNLVQSVYKDKKYIPFIF